MQRDSTPNRKNRQQMVWLAAALWLALPLATTPCANAMQPAVANAAAPQPDGAVHITRAELLSIPGTG
jgi:hypothetical protein